MTDTADPFESPKLLIERAKENILDFQDRCKAFFDANRAVETVDKDANTGEHIVKVCLKAKLPGTLRVVASDAFSNLRHSLDQAVSAASAQLGAAKLDKVYFPFAKSAADLPGALKYRCKDVPAELHAFLCSFQPHLGGDDFLWAVNRFVGPSKHQVTLRVSPEIGSITTFAGSLIKGPGALTMKWDSAKQELEVGRVGPGGTFKMKFNVPFYVALGDTEIVGGQPVLAVLDAFLAKAETIVSGLEAETARILAARAS